MQDAVIVSATRTAVGKAPAGSLRTVRPDDMAAAVIREALRRAPGVDPADITDVIIGCAMPEAEQGLNVARIASLRAGIPVSASAVTINRFCSSGLQAIAFASERVMCGSADVVIAGGTESMSLVPMGGHTVAPNPSLVESYPDVYLSTGLVAENHARESGISREEQDAFALRSHQRALAALEAGHDARRADAERRATEGDRNHGRDRRRAAPRHVARGTREAAAGVPRPRKRDGGQLFTDERRRLGGGRHLGGARARKGPCTARPLRRICDSRRRAGTLRHRPGPCDPESAEARRPDPGPNRSHRAERGVRGAGARVPQGTANRSGSAECERRRH